MGLARWTCRSEISTACRVILGVKMAWSFYRGVCGSSHIHFWYEGAKLDIIDIIHKEVLFRHLDLFISSPESPSELKPNAK